MRISKLEPSERKKGRWLVRLENEELIRVGENEMIAFSLYAGMELSEERLEELRTSARLTGFKEYALNLLSARPLSRHELRRKLEEKECPPGQALEIADRLTELGYLNDAAYAVTVVKHYTAKGYGPYKIRDELWRRGVPREYWEEAMEQREDPAEKMDAFITQKLRGIENPDRKELKKVSDALARRGFSWEEIHAALCRYDAALGDSF